MKLVQAVQQDTQEENSVNKKKPVTIILYATLYSVLLLLVLSGPVQAFGTDSRIEASARQSYVFRTYLKGDDIKIVAGNGSVTLTGVVLENFHKMLAHETVAALPWVRSVDNRLQVKGAPPTPNSDAWLLDKVKVALLFHPGVDAAATVVEVSGGVVTLRGEAAGRAEKASATAYAGEVDGVKEVKNEMTLSASPGKSRRSAGEKIDDASVSAQVNMMLLNHRATSVLDITVQTKGGIVALGGRAGNASEKALVGKLVADINGVRGVRNRITVQPSP